MGKQEQAGQGTGDTIREWKVCLSDQVQKIGSAFNLLQEVRFEAGELLRQRPDSADKQACREMLERVEQAMALLLEARRKAGTYCG